MNQPENKDLFQKSLAEVLRQKREHQEKIDQERTQLYGSSAMMSFGSSRSKHLHMPKESDSKGTAFRIRP
jgi:hypothetical protein